MTSRHRKEASDLQAEQENESFCFQKTFLVSIPACLGATPFVGPFPDHARFFWSREGLLLGLTVNTESHSGLGTGIVSALLQTQTDIPHGGGQKQRQEKRKKKRRRVGSWKGRGEEKERGGRAKSFQNESSVRLCERWPFVESMRPHKLRLSFLWLIIPQREGEVPTLGAESTWGKKPW